MNRVGPIESGTGSGSGLPAGRELSLLDILLLLWRRRSLIALIASVPVGLALLWLHLATYKFRADLSVAPPQTSVVVGSGPSVGGSLGSLASLAGVGNQAFGGLNFQLYRDAIFERRTAERLAREAWLMEGLFASEWDDASRSWRAPDDALSRAKRLLKTAIGVPEPHWQAPDAARLHELIQKRVKVATSTKTPFVRISFVDADPALATRFLDSIHRTVDEDLRARLLDRTNANIAYLSSKLASVTVAEQRAALAGLLSEQEKLRMTASSAVAFAAEPFGPAAATARPVAPSNPVVLTAALLVGLLLGVGAALAGELRRQLRPDG